MQVTADTKRCPRCGETKPLTEFWRNRTSTAKQKVQGHCRQCHAQQNRKWRSQNRERINERERARRIKRLYGLSPDEHDALLAVGCAICGARGDEKALHVDHCHRSGQVRGVLCGPCNQALGLLGESPERMKAAQDYLEVHERRHAEVRMAVHADYSGRP